MKIDYVKDGNVISIAAARTGMKFPAVAQAEGYWEGLRGNRLVPARSDLDPRGISGILEYAFILEKIAPGMAKIRLSGQGLNDILGMEMRGMPITSIFLPEARAEIQQTLERLFDGPSTVHATLSSKGGFTRKALEAQMFMAPMLDEHGRVTRALGALQIRGGIDRSPRRFSFQSLSVKDIVAETSLPERRPSHPYQSAGDRSAALGQTRRTDDDKTSAAVERIPGLAEHAQGFRRRDSDKLAADREDAQIEKAHRRSHLRVVEAE